MYSNFDYLNALEKIKSALYDIYESQEVMIGEEQDENEKNERITKYIEIKDSAVKLIENIKLLYESKNDINKKRVEVSKPQIVQISKQDELIHTDNQIEDVGVNEGVVLNDNVEEVNNDLDSSIVKEDSLVLPRFYLDSRNGNKPNFAFVPDSIFSKLKSNGIFTLLNKKLYKQDTDDKRGIIVRKDQFMKLSLSKDRQEGVLKEAKNFRIEQARKSRQKLQKYAEI